MPRTAEIAGSNSVTHNDFCIYRSNFQHNQHTRFPSTLLAFVGSSAALAMSRQTCGIQYETIAQESERVSKIPNLKRELHENQTYGS